MINVLFIGSKLKELCKLVNRLVIINKDIKICGIAKTNYEIEKILTAKQIDFIIILSNNFNYNLIDTNLKKYCREIIYVLERNCEELIMSDKYKCIKKENNIETTVNNLNIIITSYSFLETRAVDREKENKIRAIINNELETVGYNFKHFGTKYLAETIYILYTLKDYDDDNLERDIYPIVAKKYGKSSHTIKCNIRNATDIMYYENSEERIMNYFQEPSIYKPSAKKVISTILNKIKY